MLAHTEHKDISGALVFLAQFSTIGRWAKKKYQEEELRTLTFVIEVKYPNFLAEFWAKI